MNSHPALPPRPARYLLWAGTSLMSWVLVGTLMHWRAFGGLAVPTALFATYVGAILAGFALWPAELPWWLSSICLGNTESEFMALIWYKSEADADKFDQTRYVAMFWNCIFALLILVTSR